MSLQFLQHHWLMKMQRLHVIPRKHKDYDKCLVELYKPKKFVAESHTTVAPNGLIRTDSVRGIEDRHLTASPELPSLLERTSQSQNRNLYDLSLRLMDQEDAGTSERWSDESRTQRVDSGRDTVNRNGQGDERAFNLKERLKVRERLKVKDAGYYRKRMLSISNMKGTNKKNQKKNREYDENVVGPLNSKPYRKLRRWIPESYESLCAQPVILPSKTPEVPTNQTALNIQEVKVTPQPVESDTDVESFRYSDNPMKTFRAIVGRAAQNTGAQNQETLENISLGKLLRVRASQQFHHLLNLIDDHYNYSLLLLLATLAYLVYILWYDISDNLNEEGRYLGKMKTSGLPMKCFYYLMRLLRAPIF
ncbi:uncharacterized protein LOC113564288 isoform X2 [Drosophila erecta]|uniref:uncharacterized protein LOC113564288 isoform X2 n=1 Tax=Drosophila erecta TaxID=7220 RepID=UPI000F053F5D|nr:uncharacterized protein LOC113564288 isoform X2 [Drosophila erecta]